ncbi:cAMP-activated global transcriptional regulator CRP [Rhodoplanes serenus]|uniref:cAMP-activated global transcriptional regulator CRP n=1 Tax=Rhodoplanes serenus TaxID=200615 RepID=A0A447CYL6_9BRAD|nr:Crp/Fnr family transcriptional regulator [Rhodoplanes serenus]VCU10391.1 cAMP-activated global transcriptional regulator CRP [Rhodoplanes serenus]
MSALTDVFLAYGQRSKVPADQVVIRRGSAISRLYYIISGRVILYTTSPGGREIAFDIIRPGEVFALTGLSSRNSAIFEAKTITDCEVVTLERETARRVVLADPVVALEAFEALIEVLRTRTNLAESLATRDLGARLAHWILSQFRRSGRQLVPGASVSVEVSQRLIAGFSGVSRETVNRKLKEWSSGGIISLTGRTLTLLAPDELVRIAGEIDELRR